VIADSLREKLASHAGRRRSVHTTYAKWTFFLSHHEQAKPGLCSKLDRVGGRRLVHLVTAWKPELLAPLIKGSQPAAAAGRVLEY